MIEQFHPFAVSLILGILIGVERERSHPAGNQTMGVRTFPLISLLGTLCAYSGELWLSILLGTFAMGLILAGYLRSTKTEHSHDPDFGLTTEAAAGVVFATGYVLYRNVILGAALGAAVLALLISRKWIHRFVTSTLRSSEVQAAATLIVIGAGVVPFLPDHPVDPWNLFVPRRLALLTVLIGLVQFSGYALMRVFGAKAGIAISGFLGGLVSSTAVFTSLPAALKAHPVPRQVMAGAILSILGMLLELVLILAGASVELLAALSPAIAATGATGALIALILGRGKNGAAVEAAGKPLDLRALLKLTALVFGLVLAVEIARRLAGQDAVSLVSFLSGLFEMHGVSLATAVIFAEGRITLEAARTSAALALAASFISKITIVWILLPARHAAVLTLCLFLMAASGAAAYLIFA